MPAPEPGNRLFGAMVQNNSLGQESGRNMNGDVVEALLEMHYHPAIVQMFAQVFGARFLRLFKPSTTREAWVGFDQGWVAAPALTTQQLYDRLSNAIQAGESQVAGFYLGYFLQFKVLREMVRRSRYAPTFPPPYLRSELSLSPNESGGLSQHETLSRLSNVQGALVYYACPRLFDLDQIYDPPDLETIEIVEVNQAPTGWLSQDRHFLAFPRPDSLGSSEWLSDPVEAKGYPCSEWIRNRNLAPPQKTGSEIIHMIEDCSAISGAGVTMDRYVRPTRLPQSLTILEFAILP
jgi:hypothetical protein